MKRLCLVFLAIAIFNMAGCGTKLIRPDAVGKTYGIVDPFSVEIHSQPSRNAETFKLRDPVVFFVEDAVCEGGSEYPGCMTDVVNRPDAAYLKVNFDSGSKAYINFKYFFPRLSPAIYSKKRAKRAKGLTVREFIAYVKQENERARTEFDKLIVERDEQIMESDWSDEVKQLVLNGELRVGMTKEQVLLSQNPPDTPPFEQMRKTSDVNQEGSVIEKWVLEHMGIRTVYYFKNDELVRWDTSFEKR